MQAKPLATNLGEQANKIAVSVQSGDGDVLALWGCAADMLCSRLHGGSERLRAAAVSN